MTAQRPVPPDFEIVFVEQGRLECEAWYRVGRKTVNRWLAEIGKQRLIDRRAAYVRCLRSEGRWLTRASAMVEQHKPRAAAVDRVTDRRRVSPALASRAANYLRCVRNGGWIISRAPDGHWRVGTRLRSGAELVDLAVRKGFDRKGAALQIRAEEREDGDL